MSTWTLYLFSACMLFFRLVLGNSEHSTKPFYTAAVFEHNRFGSRKDEAKIIIETNLDFYKRAAEIASAKEADIIVYPEYGIFSPNDRKPLKKFLENIPDPRKISSNPCIEQDTYSQRPILRTLSCLAKNNSIIVVANMGDIQNCEGHSQCPEDGVFHFNTNVVFDKNGKLVVRYYKEHLCYEFGMDVPKEPQVPTFQTEFGKFATYTSFDIIFKRMSEVAQWPSIDGIMLTTMWVDLLPHFASVQLFQSWALGNNCTLLASNIQIPGYFAVGSGIFHGEKGALGYTFNPDGISKLVIADVPKAGYSSVPANSATVLISSNNSLHWKNDGQHVKHVCSRQLLNDTEDIHNEYRCVDDNTDNYTFAKLTGRSGRIEICNNGMCCSLDYTAEKLLENYYLGVFKGTHNVFQRYSWSEESCLLVRCESVDQKVCTTFPRVSKTVFHLVHLKATFTTRHVYPSFLASGMRLVPKSEWEYDLTSESGAYEAVLNFKSQMGRKLISVGFVGRCYDKDPPYVR